MRKDQDRNIWEDKEENAVRIFGSDEEVASRVPTQAQSLVEGSGAVLVSEFKPVPDVDYLQVCNLVFLNQGFFIVLCR